MTSDSRTRPAAPLLLAGALLAAGAGSAEPLALDPARACQVLSDEGLGTRGGYRAAGDIHRCASARKPLVAGGAALHELRFYCDGSAAAVERLGLDLYVRSRQDIQRAHGILARNATTLTERLLGRPLPEPVGDAILAGTSGAWVVDGRHYGLRRNTAGDGIYELNLTIE